jgi:hypothetical protein
MSADALLRLGESFAAALKEKRYELGIRAEIDAVLRACIAAATLGIDMYVAVLAAEKKSPVAASRLAQAKLQCHGSSLKLRRRVVGSITRLCRTLGDSELIRAAECVIALGS